LTQKITGVSVSPNTLNLVNTINDTIDQLAIFAKEIKKVEKSGLKANSAFNKQKSGTFRVSGK
jgi:hypothetical protein